VTAAGGSIVVSVAALLPLWILAPRPAVPPARLAILSIDLNDLSNQPAHPDLGRRMGQLASALRQRLENGCGYTVVSFEHPPGGGADPGYLYAHPDIAVAQAPPNGADWLIIPRLNRASTWVADLQAHVVRVRDTTIVSNRIVEIKGLELTPELAARLVERGAAWMADQISQSIEAASGTPAAGRRRCRA
jgi:hypothetical protein